MVPDIADEDEELSERRCRNKRRKSGSCDTKSYDLQQAFLYMAAINIARVDCTDSEDTAAALPAKNGGMDNGPSR